jgi:hypothetical protein
MGTARLSRPRSLLALGLAIVAVGGMAGLERRLSAAHAADHAIGGAALGLALPLLACVALRQVTNGTRIDLALWDLARWGGRRRAGAVGLLTATGLWLGLGGAVLACTAVLIGRGTNDPALTRDLVASAWIGAVGGFAYTGLFGLASSVGSRGGGRALALLADWGLGSGSAMLAVPWPRGHLRNLIGMEPVLQMSQAAAWLALVVVAVTAAGAATWRVSD